MSDARTAATLAVTRRIKFSIEAPSPIPDLRCSPDPGESIRRMTTSIDGCMLPAAWVSRGQSPGDPSWFALSVDNRLSAPLVGSKAHDTRCGCARRSSLVRAAAASLAHDSGATGTGTPTAAAPQAAAGVRSGLPAEAGVRSDPPAEAEARSDPAAEARQARRRRCVRPDRVGECDGLFLGDRVGVRPEPHDEPALRGALAAGCTGFDRLTDHARPDLAGGLVGVGELHLVVRRDTRHAGGIERESSPDSSGCRGTA